MQLKRRPTAGDSEPSSPQVALSSFEAVAADLALSPDEYAESLVLKQWVIENKDKRYVPDSLLSKWGLRADVRFV